jgi:major membrane immunogen (membrane-anchored lipoprotein)
MNRTKYPINDGELESGESGDDDESESDDVYVFLTSSGNHDATGEDFDDDDDDVDADEADDGSVDEDFESFLENMLNIELEADAGGFEFANDMFVCVRVCYY